jgi:hypothetical protein
MPEDGQNPYVADTEVPDKDDELAMEEKYDGFRPLPALFERKTRRKLIRWLFDKYERGHVDAYSKSAIYDQTGVSRQSQIEQWPVLRSYGLCRVAGSGNNRRYGIPVSEDSMLAQLHEIQQEWDELLNTDRVTAALEDQ